MPKPTERALKRRPRAVVNLAWMREDMLKDHDTAPQDYDFEWFKTPEGQDEFYLYCVDFNDKDFKENGDLVMLLAEVTDTEAMTLGRIHVTPPNSKYMAEWRKKVHADPTILIAPEPKKATEEEEQPKATRGRKPSAAAQAAKEGEEKPRTVRKPAAKTASKAPAKAADEPAQKEQSVRQRVAAKKAADSVKKAADK